MQFMHNTVQPLSISDIQMPERPKLHYIDRVPTYSNTQMKPPKMHKMLGLMRGPELVHNKLIHKQYGIQVVYFILIIVSYKYSSLGTGGLR